MLIQPDNSLQKCLLLSKLLNLVAQITAHAKSMHNSTEQIDLIRLLGLRQDYFRFVTLFGRENGVGLGSRDGKRT
jgi:hypothetical protein